MTASSRLITMHGSTVPISELDIPEVGTWAACSALINQVRGGPAETMKGSSEG